MDAMVQKIPEGNAESFILPTHSPELNPMEATPGAWASADAALQPPGLGLGDGL